MILLPREAFFRCLWSRAIARERGGIQGRGEGKRREEEGGREKKKGKEKEKQTTSLKQPCYMVPPCYTWCNMVVYWYTNLHTLRSP